MTDPTTDRSALREQLLGALDFSCCQGLGYATPEALLDAYDAAVLPATTVQATEFELRGDTEIRVDALREGAAAIDATYTGPGIDQYVRHGAELLRRMADDEPAAGARQDGAHP